ncbi:MAG: beta-N-acetylhexosaminidase [Bacteroidales bacterium]|nr:beta-N-acetylhexosaminidase [Bacteroidales bacterium]
MSYLLVLLILLIPSPVSYTSEKGECDAARVRVVEKVGKKAFLKRTAFLADFAREEAYALTVRPGRILIEAATPTGAFRARKSLEQMRLEGDRIPCCTIFDYPRFRHRGLLIDESRSFKGLDFLKKQVDAMALLKLNRLHLHLTDAAGWRLRIEAYPALTDKAAWRIGERYIDWQNAGYPFATATTTGAYGGFYTREQMKELVAYAAERHVEIIPEIEMPGHSMEVNRTYPEMACETSDGKALPFSWDLCPGRDETFTFLETVLSEVMEIFPSRYIHIGGDEAVMKDWPRCVHCKARMDAEGYTDVKQLQGYLVRRIEAFLRSKGRTMLGWDEILETGIPEGAVVMSWRGTSGGKKAAAAGHDVIMCPTAYCYLDYYQDLIRKEPKAVGPLNSLHRVWSFEPAEGFSDLDAGHILGLQGNLWCEWVPTVSHAEYMLYPRAFAIAETGWSPRGNDTFEGFRPRAVSLCKAFRSLGYNTFDLSTESERAQSRCYEVGRQGYQVIYQEKGGVTLSYYHATPARVMIFDGWAFLDRNGNEALDLFEDWRKQPGERSDDYYRLTGERIPPEKFASGEFDNPANAKPL